MVNPLADNEITSSSIPVSRRWRFLTICGSKLPSRSRGTSMIPDLPRSTRSCRACRCGNCRRRGRPDRACRSPGDRRSRPRAPIRPPPSSAATAAHPHRSAATPGAGPLGQLPHQLVAGHTRLRLRRIQVHDSLLIIDHISHRCLLLSQELHRKIYSPDAIAFLADCAFRALLER